MTDENKALLKRINDYAEEVMGDIDPQKVPVSTQLENLRPIMEEISKEKGKSLEDIFIRLTAEPQHTEPEQTEPEQAEPAEGKEETDNESDIQA